MTFVMFGTPHLIVLALTAIVPVLLAIAARRHPACDPGFRLALAALLVVGWLSFYILFGLRGWLTLSNALPLNLCDWAEVALIAALLKPRQIPYELGYFWGLGGTLQGLLTPGIAREFPDPQFITFFIGHGGIIAALLYLTLGTGMRPHPSSLGRVALASFLYMAVAGAGDWLTGANYGFLRAKSANVSLLSFLSPWPVYIPELVLLGLASLLLYYAPFLIADWRRTKRSGTPAPSF